MRFANNATGIVLFWLFRCVERYRGLGNIVRRRLNKFLLQIFRRDEWILQWYQLELLRVFSLQEIKWKKKKREALNEVKRSSKGGEVRI